MGNVFAEERLVTDYLTKGVFPKIHDEIGDTIMNYVSGVNAVDLGSCTGLLSNRLIDQCGFMHVLGIEGNKGYVGRAVQHPQVQYENFYINSETIQRFRMLLTAHYIDTVVARRVFTEINELDPEVMPLIAQACSEARIKTIVIEGRKPVKKPTAALSAVEKELVYFMDSYDLVHTYKNCRVLRLR